MTQLPAPQFQGPMTLGDIFTATFDLFKRRFGLLAALGAIPAVVAGVMVGIFWVAILPKFVGLFTDLFMSWIYTYPTDFSFWTTPTLVASLVHLVALFVVSLVQFRVQAMIAVAASDLTRGGNPTLGELYPRTQGVLPGAIILSLIVTAGIGFGGALPLMMILLIPPSGSNIFVYILMIFAMSLALSILIFYLLARLWYLIPVLALEQKSATETLGRALSLSKNDFWRILGHALLVNVVVSVPVSAVSQFLSLSESPSYDLDAVGPSAAVVVVTSILLPAWYVLAIPFQTTFQTVMYHDQLRRNEQPRQVSPGWSGYQNAPTHPAYQTPPPQNQAPPNQAPPNQAPQNQAPQNHGQPFHHHPGQQGYPTGQSYPGGQMHQPQATTPPPNPAQTRAPGGFGVPPQHTTQTGGGVPGPGPDPSRQSPPPHGFGKPQPPTGNGRPPGQ